MHKHPLSECRDVANAPHILRSSPIPEYRRQQPKRQPLRPPVRTAFIWVNGSMRVGAPRRIGRTRHHACGRQPPATAKATAIGCNSRQDHRTTTIGPHRNTTSKGAEHPTAWNESRPHDNGANSFSSAGIAQYDCASSESCASCLPRRAAIIERFASMPISKLTPLAPKTSLPTPGAAKLWQRVSLRWLGRLPEATALGDPKSGTAGALPPHLEKTS